MLQNLRSRRNSGAALLRSIAIFSGCSNGELTRIAPLATEHDFEPGHILTVQGEPGDEFFVIVKGSASAFRGRFAVATLGPGQFFGELALLDGGMRTATVVADTKMRLLVMSKQEFSSLNLVTTSVARRIAAELGARLRNTYEVLDPVG